MDRFLVVAALALSLPLVGCSGEDEQPNPAVSTVECPPEVEATVLPARECGYVGRADGSSVFFLRVQPPEPPTGHPVLELGTDLGTAPDYGGLVAIAQRTGRELVLVDLPGVGHSTPLMACPSVDDLSATVAADPAAARGQLLDAIGDCRADIEATVDIASTASALHDVVEALELPSVVAMSHGTSGRVGLEWGARHPEDLEALVLDTPLATDADPVDRVDALVADVAAACAEQPRCRRDYPDMGHDWSAAVVSFAERPMTVTVDDQPVSIGEEQLRRAVLWVAGGRQRSQALPELVEAAARRSDEGILAEYAAALLQGPPLCVGYLPKCVGTPLVAVGAMLSMYCPALMDDATWAEPCTTWGAEPEPLPEGVTVPTLVLTGRYDPFAPPQDVRSALAPAVPDAFYVEDPAGGHNVLGTECLREVRNAWLAGNHRDPPPQRACLDERVIPFPATTPPPS